MPKQIEKIDFLSQPFLAGSQKYAFYLARMQGQAFKSMMRFQIETLSFLKRRYEQDIKLVDDLIGSDDFNDAFDIYAAFLQNAVSEYSAETGRMVGLASKVAADAATRVKREAEATVEDMAAGTTAA